jgi:hypothetical protein
MNDINPVSYGKLIGKVESLENKVASLEKDIKELLELANRSKGGLWTGMVIASSVGGFIGYFMHLFSGK